MKFRDGPRPFVALALVATQLLLVGRVQASPQEVLGFGYRSIAMGNTGAAVGQGVDTVYANPALLSLSRQMGLQLGLSGAAFDLHAEGSSQPGLVSYAGLRANSIGGLLPLPFGGALKDRVTVGLGFLTPLDVVVRGRILYPEKPQFLVADRVQSVAVQAAMGIDIGWGVRIGGGFAALAALTGSVVVATDATGRIGTVVEDTLVASFAPIVGASYDLPGGSYRLGLSFRGELQARFNVVIEAKDLGALNIPPLNISGVAQYDPWQIAVEIARVRGPWQVALGATYKHWPAYPGPVESTVRCSDAPDPETPCAAPEPIDPNYSPVVAPHLGFDRAVPLLSGSTLHLRAGYAFEPSPAPEQQGTTSYYDNHRSVLSAGYGLVFDEPMPTIGFDGFVQLQLLHARDHDKQQSQGAAFDGEVHTYGTIVSAGVSATARF